jgi:hypothetical protein
MSTKQVPNLIALPQMKINVTVKTTGEVIKIKKN